MAASNAPVCQLESAPASLTSEREQEVAAMTRPEVPSYILKCGPAHSTSEKEDVLG
jgi:hypothetical protein